MYYDNPKMKNPASAKVMPCKTYSWAKTSSEATCLLSMFSTLKKEAAYSSVNYQTIWHHIPEDNTLHSHCCKNLKPTKCTQKHSLR
jgi:hypothetical protein